MSSPPISDDEALSQLRQIYGNPDWATVLSGIELAAGLGQAYLRDFSDGVSIDPEDDRLLLSQAWIARNGLRIANRENAALLALFHQESRPLEAVERLDFSGLEGLSDLRPLAVAQSLTQLRLDCCEGVSDLQPLASLNALRRLSATQCGRFDALPNFSSDSRLERLSISDYAGSDLSALASPQRLLSLSIDGAPALSDLRALGPIRSLERLRLTQCRAIASLQPLGGLVALGELSLSGVSRSLSLKPLAALPVLAELNLVACGGPVDLSDLCGCSALARLDLSETPAIGFDRLTELPSLIDLTLPDNGYPHPGAAAVALPAAVARILGYNGANRHFTGSALPSALCACALLANFCDQESAAQSRLPATIEQSLARAGPRFAARLRQGVRTPVGRAPDPGDGPIGELCQRFGRPKWLGALLDMIRRHARPTARNTSPTEIDHE
jgi:hypothetical protein